MISARALFGQWTVLSRVRRLAPAAGAVLGAAAICGCSFSERLPGLTDLDPTGSIQPSISAAAEVDTGDQLRENARIDVGDPKASKDP